MIPFRHSQNREALSKTRCAWRRNPTPRQPLRAQARRAGGVEEVAAAPSLHRQSVETPMNEAETRAEHIDPALKAAGWGVVEGSRIRREYPITPGRIEGHGRRGKPLTADYVLEYRNTKLAVVEAKAWDEDTDRRRGAGQELCRQDGHPLHLLHQRPGHLRHRHGDRQGRRDAALSRRRTNSGT